MDEPVMPVLPPDGRIAIWCPADEFGQFMSGLLGKPQTIQRSLAGEYLIRRDDLLGLHHLIRQRVNDQNEATLIQFVATVHYDDGLSVEIGSLDEFKSYAEVRAHITQHVTLSWVYLIKFRGRRNPERQQIEVTFRKRHKRDLESDMLHFPAQIVEYHTIPRVGSGVIVVKINHTMRSWGMDMESLISDHIRVFLKEKKHGVSRVMDILSMPMGWITGVAIGSITLMVGLRLLRYLTQSYTISAPKPGASIPDVLVILNQKIDLLNSFIGGGRGTTIAIASLVYVALSIVLSVVAGIAIEEGSSNTYPSFILFTQKDETQRDEAMRRFQNEWKTTAFGFCLAVLGGVAANTVTYLLW